AAMLVVASAVPGGVVAFQLAVNFYNLPVALGGRPVAQATLPGLARAHRAGDRAAFTGGLLDGAGLMLFVTVPAGVAYLVLAGPLARAVSFGEMSGRGGVLLAAALAGLALGAVGEAASVLATHGCYARRDARTPLRVMAVRAAVTLAGMAAALALLDGPGLLLGTGLAVTAGDLLAAGLLTRAGGLLGGSVRVPEVVGLEVAEATRDLRARGLRVRTGEPVASDHVHEGLVATQSIAGGERARRSDTVVIQPSLGIVLPDLAGRPADAATGRLDELDIRFEKEPATSVDVPKGAVIQTRPDQGTVLKADDVVTVVVSAGKPKVEVPDVAGRRAEAAEAALADAHLKVRPERVFADDVPEGRAVSTDPGSGSEVPWGSAVVLRVSKGPDLVEVPRVVGLSKKEAEQRLREAGLEAHYVFPVGSRVVEQSPGPGEKAKRGSGVRLLLNLF
ncbi:MAG: PASTA domain-containing protein, partial [Actinomycetota bacterium]